MATTTNRNYPLMEDNEGDKPQAVNDALTAIDTDVAAIVGDLSSGSTYTQTYATASRTIPTPPTAVFTGATDGEAKLTDLETCRSQIVELTKLVNALVDDLQTAGVVL